MPYVAYAAYLFSLLIAVVMVFQLSLALGAPWGEMAMGGRFPGRFPPSMRLVALSQVFVLACMAAIVLARAGIVFHAYQGIAKKAIWVVVVFGLLGAILNTITPSKKERALWAPVSVVLFLCAVYVALH